MTDAIDTVEDPFRMVETMRRDGWKVQLRWFHLQGGEHAMELGGGAVEVIVERDGATGKAVGERLGTALERAIKRHARAVEEAARLARAGRWGPSRKLGRFPWGWRIVG